jgi:hypothetical protein
MAKANPKALSIELEGKRYQLAFNFLAMAEFEDATGLDLRTGINIFSLKSKQLLALIWACMQINDPPPTLREVGLMINPGNSKDIIRQLAEHIISVSPDAKEDEETDPNANSPNGQNSGPSGAMT